MPIVGGKYKNPGWLNNQRPAINASELNAISDSLERIDETAGGGKRTCRFVVGTSTAGWTEQDCDFLCDGTADNEEIQAAINALPEEGGEIVILDGTYNLSSYIIAMGNSSVLLRGNGSSTILKRATADGYGPLKFMIRLINSSMRDLKYSSYDFPVAEGESRAEISLDGDCTMENCTTIGQGADKIVVCEENGVQRICNCELKSGSTSIQINSYGFVFVSQNWLMGDIKLSNKSTASNKWSGATVTISDNIPFSTLRIDLQGPGHGSTITGNTNISSLTIARSEFEGSIDSSGCHVNVCGNTFFPHNSINPIVTLGEGTRNNFITGNLFMKWFDNPVPPIQDNGTGNIVRFNSTDRGESVGVESFNGRTGAVTPQSGDYTADMVGAVPTTRTVNGKALNNNITLTAADVGTLPITYGTTDLTVGTSPLATGNVYLVYE